MGLSYTDVLLFSFFHYRPKIITILIIMKGQTWDISVLRFSINEPIESQKFYNNYLRKIQLDQKYFPRFFFFLQQMRKLKTLMNKVYRKSKKYLILMFIFIFLAIFYSHYF